MSVFRSLRNLDLRLGRESKIGLMEGAEAGKSQSGVASSHGDAHGDAPVSPLFVVLFKNGPAFPL